MTTIIRSLATDDYEKGVNKLCDLSKDKYIKIIERCITFALVNTNMNVVLSFIIAEKVKTDSLEVTYYSVYGKGKHYYRIQNYFIGNDGNKLFCKLSNDHDFNVILKSFIGKDNINNEHTHCILHNNVGYIDTQAIYQHKFKDGIIIEKKQDNIMMSNIINKIHPLEIRKLQKGDENHGYDKLMIQLKTHSINEQHNNNNDNDKYKLFIDDVLNKYNDLMDVYVVVDNNTSSIIGTITLFYQPKVHRIGNKIKYAVFIEDVVVLDSYRGCGIGRFLVEYVINKIKKDDVHDVYKISLNCSDDVKPFYEKMNIKYSGNQMVMYC